MTKSERFVVSLFRDALIEADPSLEEGLSLFGSVSRMLDNPDATDKAVEIMARFIRRRYTPSRRD